MGKLLPEAEAEVEKCARLCDYYADTLTTALLPEAHPLDGGRAFVLRRPLGVILGIMPWNFPYWQVARFAIPAIAAGNVALVKHAPNVPLSTRAFVDCLAAGTDEPLLLGLHLANEATEALIADARVAGVSLTGSVRAGRAVGAAAGRALKPSVLELGGSDPYLVLADADPKVAADLITQGRLINAGQSCIGPKRVFVARERYGDFCDALRQNLLTVAYAGPDLEQDSAGELAPLARADLRETLHDQVERSVWGGATLALGGKLPTREGYYYPATLLTDVPVDAAASREELFGPVWAVAPYDSLDRAIEWANASAFGLGAGVISGDLARADRIARFDLRAGSCVVNDFVRSDPRLPFGGVGDSGYGRELAAAGLYAFTNLKTVVVRSPG